MFFTLKSLPSVQRKKIKFRSNNFIKTGKQLHITYYLANIKNNPRNGKQSLWAKIRLLGVPSWIIAESVTLPICKIRFPQRLWNL